MPFVLKQQVQSGGEGEEGLGGCGACWTTGSRLFPTTQRPQSSTNSLGGALERHVLLFFIITFAFDFTMVLSLVFIYLHAQY